MKSRGTANTRRGVMKFTSLMELWPRIWECLSRRWEKESIEAHYQASLKTAQNPDGRSFPAYPSGKSWDEASGKTGSGSCSAAASFREPISQHSPPMSQPSPQSSNTAWGVWKLMRIQQSCGRSSLRQECVGRQKANSISLAALACGVSVEGSEK